MGYSVSFFGVEIPKLKAVYGGNDKGLLEAIVLQQAEEIDNNDAFFDYLIERGSPTTEQVLEQIIVGKIQCKKYAEGMYGYALKIICMHLGRWVGGDVYDVRELPFQSKLMENGPPIPIPVDPGDFPEIGHLTEQEVKAEAVAIAEVSSDSEDMQMELDAFRAALEEAAFGNVGMVAFRH